MRVLEVLHNFACVHLAERLLQKEMHVKQRDEGVFPMQPLNLHRPQGEMLWVLKILPEQPTDAVLLRYSGETGLSPFLWQALGELMGL